MTMPEIIPMPQQSSTNNKALPSVSSLVKGNMSIVTIGIIVVIAFVVWKFVLKK